MAKEEAVFSFNQLGVKKIRYGGYAIFPINGNYSRLEDVVFSATTLEECIKFLKTNLIGDDPHAGKERI